LAANVLNLPLRPPVATARAAASLDLLSGGRVELGLGAGAFWDAIEANGGRRLSPGEAVVALDEAIRVIREIWAVDHRGGVRVEGEHHRVVGAKRGPAPAHDIGIWVGAYKPRMLRLVGRLADGWLPSLPYLKNGPSDLTEMNRHIDEAAVAAGREPAAIRRLLNVSGSFAAAGSVGSGPLDAPPEEWVDVLTGLALEHGVSGFVVTGDDPALLRRFAEDVAPAVRERVAAARGGPATSDGATSAGGTAAAPHGAEAWDESTRPLAPPAPEGHVYSTHARAVGQHLVDVHDHLRAELEQVRDLVEQVKAGALSVGRARSQLNEMTMRQNNWTLGAYCASYCTMLTQHHGLEDAQIFPHLRRADAGLAPVIDRLAEEHVIIHEVVEGVDRALVGLATAPDDVLPLQEAVDLLTRTLLSHLSYEEEQIVEPLSRFGFYPGQVPPT
jgi:hypothetical protein